MASELVNNLAVVMAKKKEKKHIVFQLSSSASCLVQIVWTNNLKGNVLFLHYCFAEIVCAAWFIHG